MHVLFGFFSPGPMEMVIVLLIAVLLFGKRLPEVGRSLGKGLVEFKKGVRGLEDELESASSASSSSSNVKTPHEEVDDHDEATAPKFEPPTAEPQADSAAAPQAESPSEAKAETA
jgi:sec-independent protein translocase protein TatA